MKQVLSLDTAYRTCDFTCSLCSPSKAELEKQAALKAAADNDERVARDRFGNAKSISSAQFESNNDTFRNQENQVSRLPLRRSMGIGTWIPRQCQRG